MTRRHQALTAALSLLVAALAGLPLQTAAQPARAAPAEVAAELPGARWQGAAVMRWLGLQIYTLRLWAAAPLLDDGAGQALALELQYSRALSGPRIAQRAIDEMKRVAPLSDAQAARWLAAMTALFPDVRDGDRLTGVQQPGQGARFFFNGTLRGELADAEFTRLFFGIWLSPRTSEPRLRLAMLGSAS